MKKHDNKFILPRIFLALMAVFIGFYLISIISGFQPFYNNAAARNALVDMYKDAELADDLIEQRYEDLYEVKSQLTDTSSRDAISAVLKEYVGSDQFGDLRFFSEGKIYDVNAAEVVDEIEHIQGFIGLNRRACSGEYLDRMVNKSCIAFYIPIVGEEMINGLVSIVEARNFIDASLAINENATAVAIITESGTNLGQYVREGFDYTVGNDYYKFIDTITQNPVMGNKVLLAVRSGEGVVHLTVEGESYTVAVKALRLADYTLYLASLSSSEKLMVEEMWYLRHATFLLVIAIASFTISIVYAVRYHKAMSKQIKLVRHTYPNIDCPNIEQFKEDVPNAISSPVSVRKYSIVAFKISGYTSLSKHIGESEAEDVVRHAAKIFAGLCEYEESYAYLGNGTFVLCLKYDDTSFSRRINIIKAISMKNKGALDRNIHLRFNVGVCHAFGGTRSSITEMVAHATTACAIAKDKTNRPYVVYDIKINEKIAKDEKIESMMEDSLKNGDFKLFLQPKYNMKHDRIDSAEALVRWFDHSRAEYIFPGDFIGLFETNGFIVKLDHYVYLEVLKYFQRAVERGEKRVPISVNVSRVTASMDDFLDFYIENKKKYQIGDGFIMLEFTESFAADDNENILRIVKTLRKNGIGCSLDDFGSGFSSFNVLKNIPFDELKLDKCFIDAGYDAKNDDIMLKSVIDLAKSLGMRIVQEGVETEEIFNKVKAYGCDVAQGFYYAKAIPLEEYRIFIDTNTSIVYKSKVK